ncbi:hypothetical protein [Rubripirellula reticaptiva]|uniref:Uncharacterized protein n=1 Tax=Rubripirellula reticaptiva TaxID=2528013 RepID=A0A5C6EDA6_9BACT|nr:hypothetical protein [Rubripirellula reticaptiva]TWU46908.1 hypothetical protein Poly59_58820 [Rubripirellula reticaptiva]
MNSDQPIPELLQAEWGSDQVLQLFDDLRDGAVIEHVQLKASGRDTTVTIGQARAAFSDGTADAIQVRYLFEGETWCDTIMPATPTTKIIRNRLPS